MKPVNKILLTGLLAVLLSACTANRIQRNYDEEVVIIEQQIFIEIPAEPEPYVPQPIIIVQPQPETPKTKIRSDGVNNNSQKIERKTDNSDSNVRNNTGQRNTKSRGK